MDGDPGFVNEEDGEGLLTGCVVRAWKVLGATAGPLCPYNQRCQWSTRCHLKMMAYRTNTTFRACARFPETACTLQAGHSFRDSTRGFQLVTDADRFVHRCPRLRSHEGVDDDAEVTLQLSRGPLRDRPVLAIDWSHGVTQLGEDALP